MNDYEKELLGACVAFHGHLCGGLLMGFQAALYAKELLKLNGSPDEEIVCISENDACGVDAIQYILGCTAGKGNLLFHLTGKHAYSFYDRKSGKSVRLVLNPVDIPRSESVDYFGSHRPEELFTVKDTTLTLPEQAHIFASQCCSVCGEETAEAFLRWQEGKPVCLDCFHHYSRFDV